MNNFKCRVAILLLSSVTAISIVLPLQAADKKQEASAPKGKFTPAVQKVLVDVQKLTNDKNFEAAKTKLAEAEAVHPRNSYDDFFIAQLRINIGQSLKDTAYTRPALETFATNEFTPADTRKTVVTILMQTTYQDRDYAKAKSYADTLTKLEPTNPEPSLLLGQIYQNDKNYAEADNNFSTAIRLTEASGKPVPEDYYVRLAESRQQAKSPQTEDVLRQLVSKYPTAKNWQYLISSFQVRTKLAGGPGLDVYRLMAVTGTLTKSDDYIEYAESAKSAGTPGEAKSVLEKATAAGSISARDKATAASDLTIFRALAAADQKTLGAFAIQAKASPGGDLAVIAGNSYLGYGDNAKAIELYKLAISKGGFVKKTAAVANLRLGIAQFRAGDKPAALATFAGFKSSDANMNDLAALWAIAIK